MLSKLALNNVRKSIKDFTIYFLTLTFGVCLFYLFNSIESQKSMMELSKSQYEIMGMLTKVINGVSVFVSVILGFLIIYANKFLIKRRKKELGIYMTLGMEKGKISKILVVETFIISIFSLGVGLVIGVFASQGLSVITAKLFEVDLTNFHFIFSKTAFVKTTIYFGIIFIIVMIFNVFMVSKYKLIDLLNANKQNEKMKLKKLWISVVLFIISVACLGFSYRCIIHNGMMKINSEFWLSLILGSIGTLLFFMSLSGFLLKVIQGNKKFYYKGLNMFVLRQINSKINTTFVSMSLICVMLLVTIGTLSTGMGVANVMTKDLDNATPFDASYNLHFNGDDFESNINIAEIMGSNLNDIAKEYVEVNEYQLPITYNNIVTNLSKKAKSQFFAGDYATVKVPAIKLSDYNKILKMQGELPISLKDDEYSFIVNFNPIKEYYNLADIKTVEINGETFSLYRNKFQITQIHTSYTCDNMGTIILPDKVTQEYEIKGKLLNINYKESNETYEDKFNSVISDCNKQIGEKLSNTGGYWYSFSTKVEIYNQSVGASVIASYIAIYIGIVFLITCVAVLALQQLSESSDNIERYKLLREIGTEEKMINKALFWQVFIYFMIPLGLAIIHSIVGIYVANNLVKMAGNLDILSNTILVAVIFLVIYGGYFIATFLSCKNMIREKK